MLQQSQSEQHYQYDTGWINRTSWVNAHIGSDPTLNADSDVLHNLGTNVIDLNIEFWVSTDGTDANAFSIGKSNYSEASTRTYDYAILQTDSNSFKIQTGVNGLIRYTDAGVAAALGAASDFYYRIVVEIRRPIFVWIPDSWLPPTMIVEDVKAYNVAGGDFTLGADRTRDLNTVRYNTIPGASLAANQITLPPGTYEVEWSCPAYRVSRHWSRLWDTTGSVMLIMGSVMYADNNYNGENVSLGRGVLTLLIESVLELRHRCITTVTTEGFGVATNTSGYNNVYTQIKLVRKDT